MGTLGATLAPLPEYNKTRLSIASADIDYQIAETELRKQLYTALLEVEDGLAARQQSSGCAIWNNSGPMPKRPSGWRALLAGATGVQPWLDEQNCLWDAGSPPCLPSSRPSSTTWPASIGHWGSGSNLTRAGRVVPRLVSGRSRPRLPSCPQSN